jgi:hypothetical protein
MKKWVEYQLQTQVRSTDWDNKVWSAGNLNAELHTAFDRIKQGVENKTLVTEFENVFLREDHIKRTAASTGGEVSENEYRSWQNEFWKLLSGHGHNYVNDFGQDTELLYSTVTKKYNLKPDTVKIRVQIEKPGQYFVVHIDRHRYKVWDQEQEMRYEKVKEQHSHNIYIMFFNDQELGQIFCFGKKNIQWAAGDVFTWEHQSVPHYTANVGYHDNYILVITGEPNDV